MREHPVPQNVTSYEFHLIGNMTLKQFFELAGGIVLGLLVYSTNLPSIIEWPIIVVLVGVGALIAFVPFEGRPLDQWFLAFVRAIYRPTEFYWRKSENIPDYFLFTPSSKTDTTQEINLAPYKQQRISEYIRTLPSSQQGDVPNFSDFSRLSEILSLFDQVQVDHPEIVATQQKPSVTLNMHGLQPIEKLIDTSDKADPEIETTTKIPAAPVPFVPQTLEASEEVKVSSEGENGPNVVSVFSSTSEDTATNQNIMTAQTSQELPFPQRPQIPNIIVGMVFDQFNKIVDSAIVEIQDQDGLPVRAVKTNSIGQFFISTPLPDGKYRVQLEKAGLQFPTQEITLEHSILDPLLIQASES